MSLITFFLFFVAALVVFGVSAWLINTWITDVMIKKLAWSVLVVVAVILFPYFIIGGGLSSVKMPRIRNAVPVIQLDKAA